MASKQGKIILMLNTASDRDIDGFFFINLDPNPNKKLASYWNDSDDIIHT